MYFESTRYGIRGYASTLIGGRPENQDDMGWAETPLGFLLVVCDGMGGGPGGKTASYIAKQVFMQTIYSSSPQSVCENVLKLATARANDTLYNKMDEDPRLRGMGSTLVAVLINEDAAYVAHLGDSRCYRMQGKEMIFRTKDHSLVGELVMAHALTEEQARVSPQSNVITRALGNTSNHVAEIEIIPYCKGDRFFLCTDGVWGEMPQEELLMRLGSGIGLDDLIENLQKEIDRIGSNSGGHYDNHTLAALEVQSDSKFKDKWNMKTKALFGTLAGLLLLSLLMNMVMFIRNGHSKELAEIKGKLTAVEAENKDLKQKIEILESNKDIGYKDLYEQIAALSSEKKVLEESKEELEEQVADLKQQVVNLEKKLPKSDKNVAVVSKGNKTGTNADRALDQALSSIDKMLRGQYIKETDCKNHLSQLRSDVERHMMEYDNASGKKNTKKVSEVLSLLPKKDVMAQYVMLDPKKKKYMPTETLKGMLVPVKEKIEQLK